MARRKYGHCAKGGHVKNFDQTYVCTDHKRTAGPTTHCAVCGKPMGTPGNYVCVADLARR
jgi:hypothetical protein